jgi:hypothetical protein
MGRVRTTGRRRAQAHCEGHCAQKRAAHPGRVLGAPKVLWQHVAGEALRVVDDDGGARLVPANVLVPGIHHLPPGGEQARTRSER